MPIKTYQIKKGIWLLTVSADNANAARYKANQAYDVWHRTGRVPSGSVKFEKLDDRRMAREHA